MDDMYDMYNMYDMYDMYDMYNMYDMYDMYVTVDHGQLHSVLTTQQTPRSSAV